MKIKRFLILIFVLLLIGGIGFLVINNFGKNQLASLEVNSNPSLDVFIDEQNVGKTPFTKTYTTKQITLQIGSYETSIVLEPGVKTIVDRDFNSDQSLSGGEVLSFEKTGQSNGMLAVVSNPGSAMITVDGNSYGLTPITIDNLTAGSHKLIINEDGYAERSFSVNITKGYKLTALIDLILAAAPRTETQTQEPQQVFVEILSTPNGFLRVRQQPTTASNEIAQVKPGDKYPLISTDAKTGWFDIQLNATSSGWISNTYAATSSSNIKD